MADDLQKRLTIVVPVYNRAGTVQRTLRSIERQQLDQATIILVDNASTDDTMAVLQQWKTAVDGRLDVVVAQEAKPGAAAARNRGLALTDTGWVMFFDSDDEMRPGLIADLMEAIDHSDAQVVGWEIDQQLPDGMRHIGRFTTVNPLYNHLVHGILSTQRFAALTALARKAGGWDDSVMGWNDLEFGLRILLQRPSMAQLPGVRVTTHFTPASITGSRYSTDPGKWEHSLDCCATALDKAGLPTQWVDVRRIILAATYRSEGARADARRLRRSVYRHNRLWSRWLMRLLYTKHRLIPRGTGRFASLFLGKTL